MNYIISYKSDFQSTSDMPTIHTDMESALAELNRQDAPDEFCIIRAPDDDSDYDHVWENGEWVRYC